jgi:hypothetical protein
MKRYRLFLCAAVLALVGMAILLFLQGAVSERLRNENGSLARRLEESEGLRGEVEKGIAERKAQEKQLRLGQEELARLRGEVVGLRRDVAEAKVKEQEKSLAPALPPPELKFSALGSDLTDLGNATPERAATSILWAAVSGNREKFSSLLELPRDVREDQVAGLLDHFSNMISNRVVSDQFLGIRQIRPNDDGTTRLTFSLRNVQTGMTNPIDFYMRQNEGAWALVARGIPKELLKAGSGDAAN